MDLAQQSAVTQRVMTFPNALSGLRLLGVPVFFWLLLGEHDGWAIGVLMLAGISDYLDGKLARRWGQVSRLGQLLDPAADRLYIFSTLIGLSIRGVVPWWLTGLLIARDAVLALTLPVLRRRGYDPLEVTLLGKAATFNLLYAFPLLLLGELGGVVGTLALTFGWAFAIWGAALYLWSGVLYLLQVRRLVAGPGGAGPGQVPG